MYAVIRGKMAGSLWLEYAEWKGETDKFDQEPREQHAVGVEQRGLDLKFAAD